MSRYEWQMRAAALLASNTHVWVNDMRGCSGKTYFARVLSHAGAFWDRAKFAYAGESVAVFEEEPLDVARAMDMQRRGVVVLVLAGRPPEQEHFSKFRILNLLPAREAVN